MMSKQEIFEVLLVEDHPGVRQGIRAILEKEGDLRVVGEAGTGREAIELVAAHQPDLVVLDVRIPVLSGTEVAHWITRNHPAVKVLALSSHDDPQMVQDMVVNGAVGYLTKDEAPASLRQAVRDLLRENVDLWISDSLLKRASLHITSSAEESITLSRTEYIIIQHLKQGDSPAAISQALDTPPERVNRFIKILMLKYNVDSLEELAARI
jgi:DNA-binding NarL/FixJ family response regulator